MHSHIPFQSGSFQFVLAALLLAVLIPDGLLLHALCGLLPCVHASASCACASTSPLLALHALSQLSLGPSLTCLIDLLQELGGQRTRAMARAEQDVARVPSRQL